MTESPATSEDFAILNPETAQRRMDMFFREANDWVRHMIERCLADTEQQTFKYVRVGDAVFCIPDIPCDIPVIHCEHLTRWVHLREALFHLIGEIHGRTGRRPGGLGIHRKDIEESFVARYPEHFAALYAWGYLWPREEWHDLIRWETETATSADALGEGGVLQVFTAFAHGVEGSGIAFTSDGQRMYFNPAYAEPVAKIMARCMNVSVQELCRCDRTAVVSALLEKYPTLKKLSDAFRTIEAMVEVVQRGAGVA